MKNANKKLVIITIVALVLAVSCVVGTLAYLTSSTEKITNTFTYGQVEIDLAETDAEYKMVPGRVLAKDPTITVAAGSEDCYIFVRVEESANLDDFISYALTSTEGTPDWTVVETTAENTNLVYAYKTTVSAGASIQVLAGGTAGQVTVLGTVTTDMIDGLTEGTEPTLSFTAYAVQAEGFASAQAAWDATFGA